MYSVDNITFYLRFKRRHFFKRGVEARSSVKGYFGILAPIFFVYQGAAWSERESILQYVTE
jgi:hypothetical protein